MGSDDDRPIYGFGRTGRPCERRNAMRRVRRGASSNSGSASRRAPYPVARARTLSIRSESADESNISLEWDDVVERNQQRLRSDSYVNRMGTGTTYRNNSNRKP